VTHHLRQLLGLSLGPQLAHHAAHFCIGLHRDPSMPEKKEIGQFDEIYRASVQI
jgi:hypothetical protein